MEKKFSKGQMIIKHPGGIESKYTKKQVNDFKAFTQEQIDDLEAIKNELNSDIANIEATVGQEQKD